MEAMALFALNAISHAVLLVDAKGIILFANGAMMAYFEKVTGRRWVSEEVVGLDVIEVHPPPARPAMRERLAQVVASQSRLPPRTNRVGETFFVTHDKVLRDSKGEFLCVMMEKIPVSLESDG